jgi:hypothetical protein
MVPLVQLAQAAAVRLQVKAGVGRNSASRNSGAAHDENARYRADSPSVHTHAATVSAPPNAVK